MAARCRITRRLTICRGGIVENRWKGIAAAAGLAAAVPFGAALGAQSAADSGGFAVLRDNDTVAVERYLRLGDELEGRMILPLGRGERLWYRAVLLPDASAPMIEVSFWSGTDSARTSPRERARLIFRDDSVAIDQVRSTGLETRILPTAPGALPYLNLSFALLEQATRRARSAAGDSVLVPFFNLGGGQTLLGAVQPVGPDSAIVRIGTVEFRLAVDPLGRILGGAIPSQHVRVLRLPGG